MQAWMILASASCCKHVNQKMISSYVGENAELCVSIFRSTTSLMMERWPKGCALRLWNSGFHENRRWNRDCRGQRSQRFQRETYIMETGLFADLAIVKIWADETGNLVFRKTARNFNPPAAMGGKILITKSKRSFQPDHWILITFIFRAFMCIHLIQGEHENVLNSLKQTRGMKAPMWDRNQCGQSRTKPRWMVCQFRDRHSDLGQQLYS